jgi:hypothetical protein
VKYTGKRKWNERDHPRDPRTGEFVDKGAGIGWLGRLDARMTRGKAGVVGRSGALRPGVGSTKVSSFKGGEFASVKGVDQYGKPTKLTGYVTSAPGPVTMRQGRKRTPMLAVSMAETPSGGGANWRGVVYVPRDAQAQRARPGGDVARLEGTRAGDDKLAQIMANKVAPGLTSMSDEQLERALRDQQQRMSGLAVTDPSFVEQDAIAKALRAERARRAGPLEQRVSDQIGKVRGEAPGIDLNKVMRDAGISGRMPTGTGGGNAIDNAKNRLRRGDSPAEVAEFLREQADLMRVQADEVGDYDSPEASSFRLARQMLDEVAKAVDALDIPRVKRDDKGMSPASAPSAASATPETKPFSAKKGDLVVVTRTTRDYVIGKGSEERTEVIVGIVESASRDGSVKTFKAAGWGSVDRIRTGDKVMGLSAKQIDVAKVMEAAGRNTYPNSTTPKAFDSLEEVRALSKPFLLKEGEKPSAPVLRPVDKVTLLNRPSTAKPKLSLPDLRDESGKPPAASKVANAVNVLQSSNSRDEARATLQGLTVAQIKQVGEGLNRRGFTGRKADIIDQLVASTVGHRLTTDAILSTTSRSTFTPTRDPDPNSKEGLALSLRQLPGGALRGTAAELEAGDITPREAADRLSQFLRSPAARAMSQSDRRGFSVLEGRMRAAERADLGLDRPAPVPAPGVYDTITKRATLLAMLRQRSIKATRGAPDDELRRLLVEDDDRKGEGLRILAKGGFNEPFISGGDAPKPATPRESVANAQTVESLASMKRAALLAVARQHGVKLRRGAPEAEIAQAIVDKRGADAAGRTAAVEAGLATPTAPVPSKLDARIASLEKKVESKRLAVDAAMWKRKNTGARIQSATESKRRNELTELERELEGLKRERREATAVTPPAAPAAPAVRTNNRDAIVSGVMPTDGRPDVSTVVRQLGPRPDNFYKWDLTPEPGQSTTALPRAVVSPVGFMDNREVRARIFNPATGDGPYRYEIFDHKTGEIVEQGEDRDLQALFHKGNRIISSQRGGAMARGEGKRSRFEARAVERPKDRNRGDFGKGPFYQYQVVEIDQDGNEKVRSTTNTMSRAETSAGEMNRKEREQGTLLDETPEDSLRRYVAPRGEDNREIFNRYSQLTRAQFDAMPADARERILDELRSVRDSGEQQSYTNRGTRSNLGITSRGMRDASWVTGAKEKIRELTYVAPPPVDNSLAGRGARLRAGDRYALEGAALHEFPAIAKAAGFDAPGGSWKRDKAVQYLRDQAVMGDRRPKSSNPAQMAEAMRGASDAQALAILDYIEAGIGLTKADMTAIARELGVRAPKGDKRAMMHGLAVAAKEAPGKA